MKQKINIPNSISIIFFILLITVLISNLIIGGDALSGKMVNGKYYVWDAINKSNNHGDKLFVEVSKNTYYFNLSCTYLFFLTLPFFLFYRIKNIINYFKSKTSNQTSH